MPLEEAVQFRNAFSHSAKPKHKCRVLLDTTYIQTYFFLPPPRSCGSGYDEVPPRALL